MIITADLTVIPGRKTNIRNDLEELINDYKISGIDDIYTLSEMLSHWKEEIIASFSIVNGKRLKRTDRRKEFTDQEDPETG